MKWQKGQKIRCIQCSYKNYITNPIIGQIYTLSSDVAFNHDHISVVEFPFSFQKKDFAIVGIVINKELVTGRLP